MAPRQTGVWVWEAEGGVAVWWARPAYSSPQRPPCEHILLIGQGAKPSAGIWGSSFMLGSLRPGLEMWRNKAWCWVWWRPVGSKNTAGLWIQPVNSALLSLAAFVWLFLLQLWIILIFLLPVLDFVQNSLLVGGLGSAIMILESLPAQLEEPFTCFRIKSDHWVNRNFNRPCLFLLIYGGFACQRVHKYADVCLKADRLHSTLNTCLFLRAFTPEDTEAFFTGEK